MHARHLITCQQALFRVFVRPALSLSASQPQLARPTRPHWHSDNSRRTIYRYSKPVRQQNALHEALNDSKFPIDEAITTPYAHMVEQNGTLRVKNPLPRLLLQLDRDHEILRQVGINPETSAAVVKVYTREQLKELYARKVEKAKVASSVEQSKKQIELNWSIDQKDLQFKVNKIEAFLTEGRIVDVLVAPKKGARRVTEDESKALIEKLKSVQGGEEYKDMMGGGTRVVTMFFRPKKGAATPPEADDAEAEAKVDVVDRMTKKEQKKADEKEKTERRLAKKRQADEEKAKLALGMNK